MSRRRLASARRGFALLAAIALLVLTGVVTLELAEAARPRRLTTANAAELAVATEVARAGLDEARARLLYAQMVSMQGRRPDPLWQADPWAGQVGRRLGPVAVGEWRYEAVITDAGASLQVNAATEDQLRRLLIALGTDAARADRVAQSIMDWRDGDELHRLRGAERPEYLRAGAPLLPENAPLRDVATLRHVAGMNESLYARLRPYVRTVGSARVNLNTAPAPVLLALPGMSAESVELIVRWRRQGRRVTDLNTLGTALSAGARGRLLQAMPALVPIADVTTREVIVTSIASRDGVERARAEALMVKDNGVFVRWRRFTP